MVAKTPCYSMVSWRGLGLDMINCFLEKNFYKADIVFIDPEKSNKKAIHVYEKAGFKKIDEFIASWHLVPHILMKLEL